MKKYNLITIGFLLLFLATGCGKKTIIGRWKSDNSKIEYYYTFNEDKTCSYEMTVAKLDCTYEVDEKQISILYKGNDKPTKLDYRFEKNTLIIKDEKNNDNRFIKQKTK